MVEYQKYTDLLRGGSRQPSQDAGAGLGGAAPTLDGLDALAKERPRPQQHNAVSETWSERKPRSERKSNLNLRSSSSHPHGSHRGSSLTRVSRGSTKPAKPAVAALSSEVSYSFISVSNAAPGALMATA
jgi:hypothetical protein